MSETWEEMTDRHAMEKAEALARLRDAGLTQAQVARALGITPQLINEQIKRFGIPWTAPQQGPRA